MRQRFRNTHLCIFHSDVKILERSTDLSRGLTLEMLHIKNEEKSVNSRSDIQNLSQIYNNLSNM